MEAINFRRFTVIVIVIVIHLCNKMDYYQWMEIAYFVSEHIL